MGAIAFHHFSATMSNGFLCNPVNAISLETFVNNWFQEQLEQAFQQNLPIRLNHESIKPLRVIAKRMADPSPVEKLIGWIELHGEIEIKRNNGWSF
jgi:hypothetical protein